MSTSSIPKTHIKEEPTLEGWTLTTIMCTPTQTHTHTQINAIGEDAVGDRMVRSLELTGQPI